MKKFAAVIIALALILSLASCQNQGEGETDGTQAPETVEQTETAEAGETTAEAGETAAETGETAAETEETAQAAEQAGAEETAALTGTEEPERILIAYFTLGRNASYPEGSDASTSASLTADGGELVGTTEYIARLIQEQVGGELYSIQTAEQYPDDFDAVVDQNHEEADAGTLPELAGDEPDMSQYDTVFIGYPIWATDAPQAVFSFLSRYDLSGETAIAITIGDIVLDGVLYDTDLAEEIRQQFPLTVTMSGYGGREYYGRIGFTPEQAGDGQLYFDNGDITYCGQNNTMAIFYAQTDHPDLTMEVIPVGRVTSDLAVFDELPASVDITFELAEE